ncbi:MAG: glycosyltransferase family 2 protein [Acidobacteriota bacterium]
MRISVVIPTYNRLAELKKVFAAVQDQWCPPDVELEVIVVDDGSSDGSESWLQSLNETTDVRTIRQSNSGPAVARNRGVEAATGDLVCFLGDDTEPQPGWLAAHAEEHRLFGVNAPLAVLGYTSFSSEIDSPFLRFINEYGAQFGYLLIDDPCDVPFNFFYTSNISVPRRLMIEAGGFREDFPAAAWEDIEFAYRAVRDGLKIRYNPRARTVHNHCIQPRTFCGRQRTSGRSARIFSELHPELGDFLGLRRWHRKAFFGRQRRVGLRRLIELGERHESVLPRAVYQKFLDECYREGLAEGLH